MQWWATAVEQREVRSEQRKKEQNAALYWSNAGIHDKLIGAVVQTKSVKKNKVIANQNKQMKKINPNELLRKLATLNIVC